MAAVIAMLEELRGLAPLTVEGAAARFSAQEWTPGGKPRHGVETSWDKGSIGAWIQTFASGTVNVGTTWWDVDTSQVPSDVDVEEWATLTGINLSGLAKQLNGTRKDWTVLHTLLRAVPAGWWTTNGDVAAVIGSHAVPVGRHLSACGQCPSPWRVLNAAGRVSNGFQWADHTRTDTPAGILGTEGVRFNGAVADADKRLDPDALRQLLGI